MAKQNPGKSVRTRLLNLMNETGYKYMYLLSRYFNERLLYRVSVSQYKDNFMLKGGSLLYAISGLEARPTVDVDFMAESISRDRAFLPSVSLWAYSLETVIAEKLHTMIDRDTQNSRMKDFFDCYQLLTNRDINMDTLYEAVKATFNNRELQYNADLQLFTPSFVTDAARLARWKSFLKNIQWKDMLSFADVMQVIADNLQPIVEKYWNERNTPH